MTRKPSHLEVAKSLSSGIHSTGTTCFDECFLFHVITEASISKYFEKIFPITAEC